MNVYFNFIFKNPYYTNKFNHFLQIFNNLIKIKILMIKKLQLYFFLFIAIMNMYTYVYLYIHAYLWKHVRNHYYWIYLIVSSEIYERRSIVVREAEILFLFLLRFRDKSRAACPCQTMSAIDAFLGRRRFAHFKNQSKALRKVPRVDPRRFFTPPFATKRNFLLSKFKGTLSLVRRASRRIKEVLSVAADYTPFRNDDPIQGRQRAAVRKWNEWTREQAREYFILFSTLTHIWSDSSINCYRQDSDRQYYSARLYNCFAESKIRSGNNELSVRWKAK